MEETIYMNTVVQRGSRYLIRIVRRDESFYVTMTLDTGEQFRNLLIPEVEFNKEDFSAADIFSEVIEAEVRWIADNR